MIKNNTNAPQGIEQGIIGTMLAGDTTALDPSEVQSSVGTMPQLQAQSDSMQPSDQSDPGNLTKPPTVDVATSNAIQSGASPLGLAMAKKQLGKQEYIGYCESFVENVTGSGWKGSSASDAWNNQLTQGKAVSGLNGVTPGSEIYFEDPHNSDGHVGIYAGDNQFISATDNGIKQTDINQWQKSTGQKVLGYVPGGQNGN